MRLGLVGSEMCIRDSSLSLSLSLSYFFVLLLCTGLGCGEKGGITLGTPIIPVSLTCRLNRPAVAPSVHDCLWFMLANIFVSIRSIFSVFISGTNNSGVHWPNICGPVQQAKSLCLCGGHTSVKPCVQAYLVTRPFHLVQSPAVKVHTNTKEIN